MIADDPDNPVAATAENRRKLLYRGLNLYYNRAVHHAEKQVTWRPLTSADLPSPGLNWRGWYARNPSNRGFDVADVVFDAANEQFNVNRDLVGQRSWQRLDVPGWIGEVQTRLPLMRRLRLLARLHPGERTSTSPARIPTGSRTPTSGRCCSAPRQSGQGKEARRRFQPTSWTTQSRTSIRFRRCRRKERSSTLQPRSVFLHRRRSTGSHQSRLGKSLTRDTDTLASVSLDRLHSATRLLRLWSRWAVGRRNRRRLSVQSQDFLTRSETQLLSECLEATERKTP